MLYKKKKLKKLKGGGSTNNTFNILLIGVILFLVYQMTQMNQLEPETIVKEKIIYKTIEREVEDNQPYREDIYKPDKRQGRSFPPFNFLSFFFL